MPIQSIEPQRLYRRIADQLRGLIAAREFTAGAKLPPERDLARQFGVSRPSVREALIALEVEGLVEVRIGSGVFVRNAGAAPARKRINAAVGPFELLRARRLIEGECAALAAGRIRRAETDRIAALLQTMRAQFAAGKEPIEADRAFHLQIAATTGNSALVRVVELLWEERTGPLYRRLDRLYHTAGLWRAAIREHAAVLDALRSRDPQAARRAMQRHLDGAYKRFSKGWSEGRSRPAAANASTRPAAPRTATSVHSLSTQRREV